MSEKNKATIRIYYFVDSTASLHTHTPTFTLLLHASIAAPCVTLCESEVVVKHEQRAHIIFYSNRISWHRLLCIQCAMDGATRMLEMDFPWKISNEWDRCALSCIWISLYICKKPIHREWEEKPEEKKKSFEPFSKFVCLFWSLRTYDDIKFMTTNASLRWLHRYIINMPVGSMFS